MQSLPILQGREFDLIYSDNFIGSNVCPELQHQLSRRNIGMQKFEEDLLGQAGSMLAEAGTMYLGTWNTNRSPYPHNIYTRRKSEITLLP